eukprot:TRINITY_DN2325_c0_g1_i2.p1 TRINITY_DN2325_c0_g1~~TRINITY_DN2325_c0_g1_i2.p1  ORF type:complete len:103 (+),score=4.19 TRINITY_DN2325_c0_g1_i2:380-688(+)
MATGSWHTLNYQLECQLVSRKRTAASRVPERALKSERGQNEAQGLTPAARRLRQGARVEDYVPSGRTYGLLPISENLIGAVRFAWLVTRFGWLAPISTHVSH